MADDSELEPDDAPPALPEAGDPRRGERAGGEHPPTVPLPAAGPVVGPTVGRLPPRFGRYTLVRRLGSGAMGEVYLAFDSQMNRHVAVKTPHFERTADPTAIERFRREARLAAALSHPNICPVYDVGEVDGVLYYTMAYIDGVPLTRWIEDPRVISVRSVVELVSRMAQAMAQAHRQNIVHRDLKPANVMIDRRGEPIIMDFGLARHATFDCRLTQSNAVVGTPAYLAPELISGASDSPATDVYALGVVLFELLTKRLPFSGPLGELLAQITRDPPPAPSRFHSGVPQRLDAICLKALAKDPADRFATMDDFAAELTRFLRRTPSSIVQLWIDPVRRRILPTRTTRNIIGGLTGVVVALLVVLAGVVVRDRMAADGAVDVAEPSTLPGTSGSSVTTGSNVTPRKLAQGQSTSQPSDVGPFRAPTEPTVPDVSDVPDKRSNEPRGQAQVAPAPQGVQPLSPNNARPGPAGGRSPAKTNSPPRGSATTPAALLVERTRLPAEPSTLDKPIDVPRSSVSMAERTLAEMRRLDTRRLELIGRLKEVNERLTHEIPESKLKLTGDLAGSRRLGEEAVFELQQIDNRMAQLTVQRNAANGALRNSLEQELRLMAQNRERVTQRARGFDAEIRGKTVEMGRVEKDAAQLQQLSQQLSAESAQLIDAAFWNADPAGSLERKVYQAIANEYSVWLRESGSPPELLALRAIALANAGQVDEGFRDAQRALTQHPKSALVLSAMGYVKLVRGQTADAIADFNRALRFTPQSPHALFFHGLANRRRGNQSAALEDFTAVLKNAPQAPWVQAQWALQQAGTAAGAGDRAADGNAPKVPLDLPRAVELARQACDATGRQSWFCLDAFAAALAATDQWEQAVVAQEAALTLATPEYRSACGERLAAYRDRRHFSF